MDFVAKARIIGNHPGSHEPGFADFVRFDRRHCGLILEAFRTTAGAGLNQTAIFPTLKREHFARRNVEWVELRNRWRNKKVEQLIFSVALEQNYTAHIFNRRIPFSGGDGFDFTARARGNFHRVAEPRHHHAG